MPSVYTVVISSVFLNSVFSPSNFTGVDSSLVDLTDFISAAQFSKAEDVHFPLEEKVFISFLVIDR